MEILTTKDNKKIVYENGIANIYDVKELEIQKEILENKIASVKVPSDKELLNWAKQTYPIKDVSAAKIDLEKIKAILNEVK